MKIDLAKDLKAKLLFLISALILNTYLLFGQVNTWPLYSEADWNKGLEEARINDIPILVFFCTNEESICIEFKNQILQDQAIQDYIGQRFLLMEAPVDGYFGADLADAYQIAYLPAVMGFDPKGRAVGRQMGQLNQAEWLSFFQHCRSRAAQYDNLLSAWEKRELKKDGFCACAELFELANQSLEAAQAGRACLQDLSPVYYTEPRYREKLFAYGLDLSLPILPYFVENKEYVRQRFPAFPLQDFYVEGLQYNLEEAVLWEDSLRLAFILEHLLPAIDSTNNLPDSSSILAFYWQNTQKWKAWGQHLIRIAGADSNTAEAVRQKINEVREKQKQNQQFLLWLKEFSYPNQTLAMYDQYFLQAWALFYLEEWDLSEEALRQAVPLIVTSSQTAECKELDMRLRFVRRSK